jgi:hypothetical protein
MLPGRKFSKREVCRAARRVGWRAVSVPRGTGIHDNQEGGYALFDADKRCIHGAAFDVTADDVVTYCAIEVLRRAGRQILSLPRLPFRSETETVLALESNSIRELLVRRGRWSPENAMLID